MTKQFCCRGHDTFVVGRVQRMCRECRRMNDRARWNDKRRGHALRYYHSKGFLRRINRVADAAMQKLEALFGGR